jgi:hypothetical protein
MPATLQSNSPHSRKHLPLLDKPPSQTLSRLNPSNPSSQIASINKVLETSRLSKSNRWSRSNRCRKKSLIGIDSASMTHRFSSVTPRCLNASLYVKLENGFFRCCVA